MQIFTIVVKPCQITDYRPSPEASTLQYYLGDASLTGSAYAFEQVMACGYP